MKRTLRKLRARAGMTLSELLAAMVILALVGTAITAGTAAALRIYRQSTVQSQAAVLCSTLVEAVSDELRYADKVQADGTFDSALYGQNVAFAADEDGHITLGGLPILGGGAYPNGLTAQVQVQESDRGGTLDVTIRVQDGETTRESTFSIRPINGM